MRAPVSESGNTGRLPVWRGFTRKLIVLAVLIVLVSAGSVALYSVLTIRDISHDMARAGLADDARFASERISRPLGAMQDDARLLAGTSPLPGIQRGVLNPGGDGSPSGPEFDALRARLETIFTTFFAWRPYYTQLRLIGVANEGREVVRVNNNGAGVRAVAVEELQQKGGEPYIQSLLARDSTEPFFSDVSFNREYGQVGASAVQTIRMIHPILDEADALFGAIVLNADFEALINQARIEPKPGYGLRLSAGPDFTYVYESETGRFRLDDTPPWPEDSLVSSMPIVIPGAFGDAEILVEVGAPRSLVLQPAQTALRGTSLISLVIVVLCLGAAWIYASRLTQPLRSLDAAIRKPRKSDEPLSVDIRSRDEIGSLARAFTRLTNDLIRERQAETRSILESAGDAIVTVDPSGRILTANSAASSIFGYSMDEFAEEVKLDDLIAPEHVQQHRHYLADLEDAQEASLRMAQNRDLEAVGKGGRRFPVEIVLGSYVKADQTIYVASIRDISERKEAERKLQRMIESLEEAGRELERSNEELDKFAYAASHDLKAPLRVIYNASTWLEEDLEEHFDTDTRDSMEMIKSRVRRMERLLDDLLEYSRIGRGPTSEEEVSGAELMEDIIGLCPIRGDIRVEASDEVKALTIQRFPLHSVLLNLVSNGIKHHDRQSGTVRVDVEDRGDTLEFTVTDDGPGIPPDMHTRIFGMFQTLKTRDETEGSGMGLALAKRRVEVAGGRISVHSDGTRGTCFRFTLPKESSGAADEAAA